jgi:2-C-methyl-D-erythritol 2,4-cyclodiphosphate synthase
LFRTGLGYDVHAFAKGRPLILGGVEIPFESGLLGHSDADVLIHAIMDGILGALAKGDIGSHFPDNDPAYKDMDSFIMLKQVANIMELEGYGINNIDCVVVAEKPKLAPHISEMREKISKALHCDTDRISVKATTTEGLGFTGRKEGIEAFSIVTLIKS